MRKKVLGFTLIEIIIAIIMVGVVASLAFVQYGTVIEKSRAKEAEGMLIAIFSNVQRVKVETGSIANVVVNGIDPFLADLRPLDNFQTPAVVFIGSPTQLTYSITRKAPISYTFVMVIQNATISPVITCSGGPAGLCAKLGY